MCTTKFHENIKPPKESNGLHNHGDSKSLLFSYSVPGGELFERIVAEEYLMEDDAVDYVRQILEALRFMHERNVVHLDLKVGGTDFLSH